MAFIGGLHFWWPKMTGRMYTEALGKVSAILVFVGFNLTFFPQFVLGYMGMPRRYHAYPDEFQMLNVLSTAGAGDPRPRLRAARSAISCTRSSRARPAPANPWGAKGLEWEIPSPPPTFNFDEDPIVTEPAYNYKPRPGGARWLTLDAARDRPWRQRRPSTTRSPATRRRRRTATPRTTRSCSTTSTAWSSSSRPPRSGCGCSWSPKSCSSAACSWPTSSTARCTRKRGSPAATT